MASFENMVVVVCGGGAGLGKGIALEFAKAGARVVVASVGPINGAATVKEIKEMGGEALFVQTDARRASDVERLVRKTMETFGRIDILVNNVGGLGGLTAQTSFLETGEQEWDAIINLNLKTNYLCTRAIVPTMIEQGRGNIINISSLAGTMPWPPVPAYGVTKAGIINLTQSLAQMLAPHGVRVNCIAPGRMDTYLSDGFYKNQDKAKESRIASIPTGRLGLPEDIGKVAVFLASDAADYITGQTLLVSGGLTTLL
jgi:3-oxoacyl-[acyl-carrier protein] reductase